MPDARGVLGGQRARWTRRAVDELVRVNVELVEYSVTAVVEGIESLAQTRVSIRPDPPLSGGLAMIKSNAQTGAADWRARSPPPARTRTSWCPRRARVRGVPEPHDRIPRELGQRRRGERRPPRKPAHAAAEAEAEAPAAAA